MKKLILSILSFCLVALLVTSCASKNGASTNLKVSKSTVTGTWTVSDVRLEGFPNGYRVENAFGMAPYKDFIGSTWKLYGGYSGYITLPNGTTQNIYWDLLKDGLTPVFQFKKVDAGEKAREVTEGYRMRIDAASKSSLVLSSPFDLANGTTANIVYTLTAQ
ncbi:hypothetical protein [Pedobacter arcticus]|uniref:hypothetical protein n=1 Tax=Pedobacter arcticus TaxID=752140 RepID=UPI0012B5C0A1|nr:hypothetical protein [Pedobacter arcticus]